MPRPDHTDRADHVIPVDNLEEFTDPVNYDLEETPASASRISFYAALAKLGGSALELGCGTGLVALPMAGRGIRVTGVDLSAPMLNHARAMARREGLEVDWVQADARDLALGHRFDLVFMAGHAFQAFLTRVDQDRLLACVTRHLAAGGVFAFDNRNPSGHDLRSHADEEMWRRYSNAAGHLVTISGTQDFDAATQTMYWTTWRRWHDGVRRVERRSRIACRFMGPPEQNALLRDHGFELVHQFGDWNGAPLTERSEEIISICRLARESLPAGRS
jgi:SAM-dependent methyltransferase